MAKALLNVIWKNDMQPFLNIFDKYGALILNGTSASTSVDDVRLSCNNLLEEYMSIAKNKATGLGIGKENGYRELVLKDLGRYDLNLDHLVISKAKTQRELSTNEQRMVAINSEIVSRISPFLQVILGSNFKANGFGVVTSHPGTEAQRWHVDSSHLFQHYNEAIDNMIVDGLSIGSVKRMSVLPCHFVTVFYPLYGFSESIGPTEVALGSHRLTSILRNSVVEDQYPSDDVVEFLTRGGGDVTRAMVDCDLGDIVIMDGRTLHRGLANRSHVPRSLVYASFCRPWYAEYPTSHNEASSLFSPSQDPSRTPPRT